MKRSALLHLPLVLLLGACGRSGGSPTCGLALLAGPSIIISQLDNARAVLTDPPRGYEGLRRIPADLTFNLGFRIDTNAGGFLFAFSNILGFVPVAGGNNP